MLPTILPFIFRPPKPIPEEILNVQDAYLQAMLEEKGIVSLSGMTPLQQGIYLWKEDITRISSDDIVNPANSTMLGCFIPCHGCINNAIHSAAGIQLRLECSRIMEQPAGRKSLLPTIFPAAISSIPSDRSNAGRYRKKTADCWLPATVPVWKLPLPVI